MFSKKENAVNNSESSEKNSPKNLDMSSKIVKKKCEVKIEAEEQIQSMKQIQNEPDSVRDADGKWTLQYLEADKKK